MNAAGHGAYVTLPEDVGITYLELGMEDSSHVLLDEYVKKSYEFLSDAVDTKGYKILIHCIWGKSRSVAVLMHFLMMYYGLRCMTALTLIVTRRPAANPNNGFMIRLFMYEQEQQKRPFVRNQLF